MPILPIDSGRYTTPEMKEVFEEEARLQKLLDVEAALAWAHAQVGNIPKKNAEEIIEKASTRYVKLCRVKEIEVEIKHDLMAMVEALSEVCGSSGAYVHLGVTSSDILDTATALQQEDALEIIMKRLDVLEVTLINLVKKYSNTLMLGRTHGQHALPITLGFKFAVWLSEITRHIDRLGECSKRVLVGKISGAVGTQAGLGPKAMKIQALTMKRLKLRAADISTQIIQRDNYAELVNHLANLASSLDNFAIEIRELQRPEIDELAEPFEIERQVGSSTMPHKHNPILCERVCGLAKIMRGLVVPALENVPTWHERDLTQSSSERFTIPTTCILADYMIFSMSNILAGLYVNEDKMRKNLNLSQGRIMSEAVMLRLVKKGIARQEAYSLIRKLALLSETRGQSFKETLIENETITSLLSDREIEESLNPKSYLGTVREQIDIVLRKTEEKQRNRRKSENAT